ncbi:MAG: PAS domain S-box protein [Candidatus Methylacidiphilales bacterium]|nr:PAS domain S-box protein [Candidatus Methylacidiphilales bacterium]
MKKSTQRKICQASQPAVGVHSNNGSPVHHFRNEEGFRHFFNHLADPMLLLDETTHRFADANQAALRLLEVSSLEQLQLLEPGDVSPEYQPDGRSSAERAKEIFAQMRDMNTRRFDWVHRSFSGKEFPVEVLLTPLEIGGRQMIAVLWRDISSRLEYRAAAEIRLAALEAAANAIVITDAQGVIIWTNEAFTRLTGYLPEDAHGLTPRMLKSGAQDARLYADMWGTISQGKVWSGELVNRRKDGTLYHEEMTITPLRIRPEGPISHYIAVKNDTTERRRLQQQYLRAQRSETLGTLAGGIAHDLNNILLPVTLAADMLKLRHADPEDQRMLDTISTCARRGADMVRQIVGYARGVEGRRVEVQVRHLMREVEKMIRETFPRGISIDVRIPSRLRVIEADHTQIQQVLMNLCINARDAMPSGGRLGLSARDVEVDPALSAQYPGARTGPYLLLEVEDNGEGIRPEIVERIFDPFFTTKEVGKGTGLGLSTVQSIVRSHQGFVTVDSAPGRGTRFSVYLPALREQHEETRDKPEPVMNRGHGELILLVDDETAVCDIVRSILEEHGYRCLVAHDGAEALALYASHRFEIAAVITDLMMPVMDGSQMIQVLRRMNPVVRVICTSGKAGDRHTGPDQAAGGRFLAKPFDAASLLRELRELLRDAPAQA